MSSASSNPGGAKSEPAKPECRAEFKGIHLVLPSFDHQEIGQRGALGPGVSPPPAHQAGLYSPSRGPVPPFATHFHKSSWPMAIATAAGRPENALKRTHDIYEK